MLIQFNTQSFTPVHTQKYQTSVEATASQGSQHRATSATSGSHLQRCPTSGSNHSPAVRCFDRLKCQQVWTHWCSVIHFISLHITLFILANSMECHEMFLYKSGCSVLSPCVVHFVAIVSTDSEPSWAFLHSCHGQVRLLPALILIEKLTIAPLGTMDGMIIKRSISFTYFHQALFPNHRKNGHPSGFPTLANCSDSIAPQAAWWGAVLANAHEPVAIGRGQQRKPHILMASGSYFKKSFLQSYSEIVATCCHMLPHVATCCHMLNWRKSKELTGNSEDAGSNGWAIFQEACDAW